jgi:hypothetical protein
MDQLAAFYGRVGLAWIFRRRYRKNPGREFPPSFESSKNRLKPIFPQLPELSLAIKANAS